MTMACDGAAGSSSNPSAVHRHLRLHGRAGAGVGDLTAPGNNSVIQLNLAGVLRRLGSPTWQIVT